MPELKEISDQLQAAWKEYRTVNDSRLEAKADGKSVAELEEKMEKLDAACSKLDDQLKSMQAANARAPRGGQAETKAEDAAFSRLLRKGIEGLNDTETKALSANSDPDGGYLVQPDMSGRIIRRIFETSPIRSVASVQTLTTSDALEGIVDSSEMASGMVGETSSRPTTASPTIGKWRIPVFEQYAAPLITQKLLDDSGMDVEGWLGGKAGDKFARVQNTKFVRGTGVNEPRGFMSVNTVLDSTVTDDSFVTSKRVGYFKTGVAADFAATPDSGDVLINVVHGLKSAYRDMPGCAWAMHRSTFARVRRFKDSQGQYIWSPGFGTAPSTLLGFQTVEMNDMDLVGANKFPVAFANWREFFQIVDRAGMRLLRDPYTKKPYVEFYFTNRFGSDVVNHEAAKFVKCEV